MNHSKEKYNIYKELKKPK